MNTDIIKKLETIFSEYTEANIKINDGVVSKANPPASVIEINKISNYFKKELPKEYVDFLSVYNGCELYNDDDIDGFHFYGTDEIIEENESVKEDYEEDWDSTVLIFAYVIGEGNYIGFRFLNNEKYEIIDCFHEELPQNWEEIENSFNAFLNNLIESKGKKYWLK